MKLYISVSFFVILSQFSYQTQSQIDSVPHSSLIIIEIDFISKFLLHSTGNIFSHIFLPAEYKPNVSYTTKDVYKIFQCAPCVPKSQYLTCETLNFKLKMFQYVSLCYGKWMGKCGDYES